MTCCRLYISSVYSRWTSGVPLLPS